MLARGYQRLCRSLHTSRVKVISECAAMQAMHLCFLIIQISVPMTDYVRIKPCLGHLQC